MRNLLIITIIGLFTTACSPIQLLSKALIDDTKRDNTYAEQQRIETQKHRMFYCAYTAKIAHHPNDNEATQRAIVAHNEKWNALCQPNLSVSQPNNPE